MDIVALETLQQTGNVVCTLNGIIVTVRDSWVVEGEDRLSYTAIIRLIECCREHHWKSDVLSVAHGETVDSICKLLTCNFIKPITIGSKILIKYSIVNVRKKSYTLRFEVFKTEDVIRCATCDLVSVFYDPLLQKSTVPPSGVIDHLLDLCKHQQDVK